MEKSGIERSNAASPTVVYTDQLRVSKTRAIYKF
uniref:Uncharacterized protein n=1 Tax=Rhizophora mucronata TaxID=61149 RepID=A0A2P2PJL1_RHIMU